MSLLASSLLYVSMSKLTLFYSPTLSFPYEGSVGIVIYYRGHTTGELRAGRAALKRVDGAAADTRDRSAPRVPRLGTPAHTRAHDQSAAACAAPGSAFESGAASTSASGQPQFVYEDLPRPGEDDDDDDDDIDDDTATCSASCTVIDIGSWAMKVGYGATMARCDGHRAVRTAQRTDYPVKRTFVHDWEGVERLWHAALAMRPGTGPDSDTACTDSEHERSAGLEVLCEEHDFRRYQSGQPTVFSGAYMLQYVYTLLLLQFCGRSGPTGTFGNSVPPTKPRTQAQRAAAGACGLA